MRQTKNARWNLGFLTLLFATVLCAAPPPITAIEVTISYSLVADRVSLHEPVFLSFRLQNNSEDAIQLDLGKNKKENFVFTVTRPDGTRLAIGPRRGEGIGTMGLISIEAGREYKQELLLNEWIEFSALGRYEIEVHLAKPPETGEGAPAAEGGGFRGAVQVLPEDTERLKVVCESLARRVENSSSYVEAANATEVLSFVQDPIAVPYLERALRATPLVDNLVISGLEKIADDEAVRVLISALDIIRGPLTAVLAKSALERINQQTQDPGRKQIIQKALDQRQKKTP